jgi:Flp pilus assembly protein TadG
MTQGKLNRLCRRVARMWGRCGAVRGECGSSLVEVALSFALLGMPLIIGTADMGFVVYDSIEVTNAAHAAAMYGMQSATYAANTSGMTTAAQNEATDFGTNLSVTPTSYYACSSAIGGTQYTGSSAQTNATSACTGGTNHALPFVKVTTSVTVTPPIHLPILPRTFTVTGSSVMEVEQ